MINKDILTGESLSDISVAILKRFFAEPIAFKFAAEPGWRAVICIPDSAGGIDVGIFDIKEWASFASFSSPTDLSPKSERTLVDMYSKFYMPVIPDNYIGNLSPFFESIKGDIPDWNRLPPPTFLFGCLGPSDNDSYDDVAATCRKSFEESKAKAKESEIRADNFKNQAEKLLIDISDVAYNNGSKIDKDKLN